MSANRAKPPTVRLRRLAAELRRLREESGYSREQVEDETGVHEGTLYRIETTRARPQRRTLITLLNLYSVPDSLRSELLELAKAADGAQPYHWQLPGEYGAYISFETEARSLHNYESLFIPGLLQTEDYAREVIRGTLPLANADQVEQRVQARMERQRRLAEDTPLTVWAIMDEAAVRRMVGGVKIMIAQLAHLLEAAKEPNVTLQVITFDMGAHPGMPGSFVYLEFDDPNPELVYVDTLAGDLFLEGEPDVRTYSSMFDHLRAIALSPALTDGLISTVKKSLEETVR